MPPSANNNKGEASFSHAVSRSVELLSCGKTALKIAKAQHAGEDDYGGTMWWACQQPNELALCSWKDQQSHSHLDGLCEDGLSLLRAMDAELSQLESLVRRRGHTNDPTEEIAASVRRLETDAKELSSLVKTGFQMPRASAQCQRHNQLIASWLESVATQQMTKLKEILKVRGNVLADQAQRRKLLNPQGPGNHANSNSASQKGGPGQHSTMAATSSSRMETKKVAPKAMDTPLFTMAPLPKPNAYNSTNGAYRNGSAAAPSTSASAPTSNSTSSRMPSQTTTPTYARTNAYGGPSSVGGYGGGYGGGGYGGGAASNGGYYGGSSSSGMRQRRATASSNHHHSNGSHKEQEEAAQVQAQIQQRQQQRQTESRLQEAQQAERTLAELVPMFGKMSTLISQQGEVLEKVEDDAEAGLTEIIGGQEEITTLYSLKKGNRGLIIKLFSLLIFLIIFMRFYAR